MLEITMWSLLVGNFGWQAVVVSGWLRWRQILMARLQQEEEESLTCFESKEDSISASPHANGKVNSHRPTQPSADQQMVGWEFKIVRASSDLFRDQAVLQQLCQEEAKAGWILLEKLDDRRIRFKRLIALRNVLDETQLPYDPYRSHYGASWTRLHLLSAIAAATVVVIPSYFAYSLVSKMLTVQKTPAVSATTAPSGYEKIPPQNFPPTKK
jgi:hypothetical protein